MYLPTKFNADRVILLPRIMEIMAQSIPARSSFPHSFGKLQMLLGEVDNTVESRPYDHPVYTTTLLLPPYSFHPNVKITESFIILKTSF